LVLGELELPDEGGSFTPRSRPSVGGKLK